MKRATCQYCGKEFEVSMEESGERWRNFFCSAEHYSLYKQQEESTSWENEYQALKELYPNMFQ